VDPTVGDRLAMPWYSVVGTDVERHAMPSSHDVGDLGGAVAAGVLWLWNGAADLKVSHSRAGHVG